MRIKRSSSKNILCAASFVAVLIFSSACIAQDCKAKVDVNTNNTQALVIIDSVLVGKGNMKTELSQGSHIIRIQEAMYRWGQKEILDTIKIVDCTKPLTFTYDFSPVAEHANNLGFYKADGTNGENFFTSTTFKILIGSAAVLGGISAYFKIKADKKYDEYLNTKNQSTLDEVDRLDLISGISFGLLQINFGYLIYKFLAD